MLDVVTGRFHPDLEDALIHHLLQAKGDDPFASVAVLVPSASLLGAVRRLLALKRGMSLLNVHVLSFHQLALRLSDEYRARAGSPALRVTDDLFFEQLVRHLVQRRLSGLAPLRHIGHSSGTWAALWSTIRDLKDGGVDPVAARRAVDEGCFDRGDEDWLRALFSLHAAVNEVGAALDIGTADDLAASLLPHVPESRFLKSLRRILYYGFYDLTHVQLSLFEAVSAAVPTTLFFPLQEGPSYRFARRFFDRHIEPRIASRTSGSEQERGRDPILSISSVIGVEEELAATCRTILDLCETNAYRFQDIGVVARTLEPYRTVLQDVFGRYCVPFTTTAGRPLIHDPLCKAILQLASLPVNDFYREPMLDVIGSPLYRSSLDPGGSMSYRPELWRAVVSALRITRGRQEWKRLQRAGEAAFGVDQETDGLDWGSSATVTPDVIALCWKIASQLIEDCEAMPQQGTVGRLLEAFRDLTTRHFGKPDPTMIDGGNPEVSRLQATWDAIEHTWSVLHELEAIGETVSWIEFVELLTHAFQRAAVPINDGGFQGVMVLDAMAARGLSFRALFVLGLNDNVFPRSIREDPFLRDRHRRVLDATLGFKIDEKLQGYDEETLLFALLRGAGKDRLHLSFQRADEQGRPLAASPYVAECGTPAAAAAAEIEVIPRRLTDRLTRRPALRRFLPPSNLAQWMGIQGLDPTPLLRATERDAVLFRHAAEALEHIEDASPGLTAFDGHAGPVRTHWARLVDRGIAPTPLERYARCPFQYFAVDVLRVEPSRGPASQEPMAPLLGTLLHLALRRCYESLLRAGWPDDRLSADQIRRCMEHAVADAATECEDREATGHFLLWELAKERIGALVLAAVADDLARCDHEPYRPVAFEVEASGTLPLTLSAHTGAVKIRGRVDRIDRHRDTGALRIIDYKYKTNSAITPADNNLKQAAVRGYRLQPPLYAFLKLPGPATAREVEFIFVAPGWPTPITRRRFDACDWSSELGRRIGQTLGMLFEGVHDGRFFILPDEYCTSCDFRVACRREHQATWWRAHRASEAKTLRALRSLKVKDE
ncbi:MAG TPA: PD-(D/E)XK nuclease family protein [Nitrospira sp.]|nr:PD-(D/E)XK nuclease family protein [Nitrospira sp.]